MMDKHHPRNNELSPTAAVMASLRSCHYDRCLHVEQLRCQRSGGTKTCVDALFKS